MFRIKEYRQRFGITQKDLAEKLGIARNTFNQYENNKRQPDIKTLQDIADFFEVSINDLIDNEKAESENSKKGIKIPVLGYVRAGIPLDAIEDILDEEEISHEMASKGDYFALRVKGDSMEPRIKEGDVVIVRKQTVVENGQVAVVLVNGNDATVKKFVKHEDGISLIGFNPSFTPLFYTKNEVASLPVEVIGKVVELRAKFE